MRALITGVNGQDGYYLSQLLIEKGYEVFGLDPYKVREVESPPGVTMIPGDLLDAGSLHRAVKTARPDEVYNLGAQSFVGSSWAQPALVGMVNGIGVVNLLDALRDTGAKFYQASTSEMFGSTPPPQSESTAFHPRSPYGVAKLYAHWATINARESYGMQTYCGILFNHESPRRGYQFVTKKVAKAVADIVAGKQDVLKLGNLDAKRDWGHAKDFVKAMWLMLQGEPDDYVVATGELHSVREMVEIAFQYAGLDWVDHVEIDPAFFRPAEVNALCGDASKIRAKGWVPEYSFRSLIEEMVSYEMRDIVRPRGLRPVRAAISGDLR